MLNIFSRSLIIWEPAIETWAQEMNVGPAPENELGARRAGNYTLTPAQTAILMAEWIRRLEVTSWMKDVGELFVLVCYEFDN